MCEPAEAKAMFDRMDDEIKEEKRMREQNDLRFRNRNPTAAAAAPAPASTPARAAWLWKWGSQSVATSCHIFLIIYQTIINSQSIPKKHMLPWIIIQST